jgi:hypothetical protein
VPTVAEVASLISYGFSTHWLAGKTPSYQGIVQKCFAFNNET